MHSHKFFSSSIGVFLGALICCGLWGSAYPFVKLGMGRLSITSSDIPDQILFAGCRFTMAGLMVILLGSLFSRKLLIPRGKEWKHVGIMSLFQTVGQYIPYYIGLAHTSGTNTSVVDSLSYFFAILASCLLFHLEKFTWKKFLGCLLGFAGVVLINLNFRGGSLFSFRMSFMGEGLILLSAVSYAFSSVCSRMFSQNANPIMLSGWQFFTGGLVILCIGLLSGGWISHWTLTGLLIFLYLVFVSTFAFTLWTVLLKYNDVSRVSIYGFLNPIFGVVLSALILGEKQGLQPKYLIALIGISCGISLVNVKSRS